VSKITLADGHVTPTAKIVVQLIDDDGMTHVLIIWPAEPTRVAPAAYGETAARITRLIASSSTELSRRRARRH
jgi:hypothetical protein